MTEVNPVCDNFYPRSPCGERPSGLLKTQNHERFLSTLSLRRATAVTRVARTPTTVISIHALLAESDMFTLLGTPDTWAISIHALLAESDGKTYGALKHVHEISIHALLAESDVRRLPMADFDKIFLSTLSLRRATGKCAVSSAMSNDFYPRSPCGERRPSSGTKRRFRYFYPRSPCGERLLIRCQGL